MRLVPGIVVIAMMTAGTALGAITFSVTGPGGASSYDPAPGEPFQIQVALSIDIPPIMGWSADLVGPPGLIPLPMAIGGISQQSPGFISGVVYTTTLFNPPTDDAWGLVTLANATCATWDFEQLNVDAVTPLLITPEPVSAVLLLGGLPLLRRRR
jgi:hypothetical protein